MDNFGGVGYYDLHENPGLNFTLNRLARTIPPDELKAVAARVSSLDSWITEMQAAGERAESQGRLVEAARYYQGAEFYMKLGGAVSLKSTNAQSSLSIVGCPRWPPQEMACSTKPAYCLQYVSRQ